MHLGIIADDFTGGTDIAGFIVQNGLSVTQYIGVPGSPLSGTPPDAAVISLKSRSCPAETAVRDSLAALGWLQEQGYRHFFFKYCSTFDSTDQGNIGPVTDALLGALTSDMTVVEPALPVNGRTVYMGYLFVNGVLLNESGMRHHPVTPMLDASIVRLMERQSGGKAACMPFAVVEAGSAAIRGHMRELREKGIRYVVPDALKDEHLIALGEAVADLPLLTGGSGLGMGIALHLRNRHGLDGRSGTQAGRPPGGRCVILAGSASTMTNAQVERYRDKAPAKKIDARRCVADSAGYAAEVGGWIASLASGMNAPLVYSTSGPEELAAVQREYGAEVSGAAVERFFADLAVLLRRAGVDHYIIAGGETSGSVVKALGITAFHIGPQIAPGVPWVRAVDAPVSLALKSGNFGDEHFFSVAQDSLR
jgi:uncharacterized protein YgbK (DUF1537 family)